MIFLHREARLQDPKTGKIPPKTDDTRLQMMGRSPELRWTSKESIECFKNGIAKEQARAVYPKDLLEQDCI